MNLINPSVVSTNVEFYMYLYIHIYVFKLLYWVGRRERGWAGAWGRTEEGQKKARSPPVLLPSSNSHIHNYIFIHWFFWWCIKPHDRHTHTHRGTLITYPELHSNFSRASTPEQDKGQSHNQTTTIPPEHSNNKDPPFAPGSAMLTNVFCP